MGANQHLLIVRPRFRTSGLWESNEVVAGGLDRSVGAYRPSRCPLGTMGSSAHGRGVAREGEVGGDGRQLEVRAGEMEQRRATAQRAVPPRHIPHRFPPRSSQQTTSPCPSLLHHAILLLQHCLHGSRRVLQWRQQAIDIPYQTLTVREDPTGALEPLTTIRVSGHVCRAGDVLK
jgi:hypothetical protein